MNGLWKAHFSVWRRPPLECFLVTRFWYWHLTNLHAVGLQILGAVGQRVRELYRFAVVQIYHYFIVYYYPYFTFIQQISEKHQILDRVTYFRIPRFSTQSSDSLYRISKAVMLCPTLILVLLALTPSILGQAATRTAGTQDTVAQEDSATSSEPHLRHQKRFIDTT